MLSGSQKSREAGEQWNAIAGALPHHIAGGFAPFQMGETGVPLHNRIISNFIGYQHRRTGRHFTVGAGKFALKKTIFPKSKSTALKLTFSV